MRDCSVQGAPPGSIKLVGEHLAAVCSPAYMKEARTQKKPLNRPDDLRHHVMLTLHDPTGRWPWLSWARWLEAAGVDDLTPEGTLTFDSTTRSSMRRHGQGVALARMTSRRTTVARQSPRGAIGRSQGHRAAATTRCSRRERPSTRGRALVVEWMQREMEPAVKEAAAA